VLGALDAVSSVGARPGGRPGEVALTFAASADARTAAAAALRALLDAGVPVAEFSLEGGRLSDAFLEVVSR
jgi:ABC-2 type transport system ATP-binding protein